MPVNRPAFFATVRRDFGRLTQSQVDGFNALLDAWDGHDPRFTAYALATAYHETASTMQPIEEYGRGKGRPYGPTGFWGRGYIQLTWEANYRKAGAFIGVDLLKKPALALDPCNAAKIMVQGMTGGWFTGKKLGDYFNTKCDDPVGARRIINGTDKASLIASYHRRFLAAVKAGSDARPVKAPAEFASAKSSVLQKDASSVKPGAPPGVDLKVNTPTPTQPAVSGGFFVRLLRALYPRRAA